MPEHDTNERVITGEVTETPSSDSYIARHLDTIRAEIEATGKIIDIPRADVLKPRLTISGVKNSVITDDAGKEKQSSGSPLARFASSIFKERQQKKAA